MSTDILLVFPKAQRDMTKHLRELLEEIPPVKETDGEVKIVRNVKAAWQSLEERHFALIIAHRYLPSDKSPLDPETREAQLGLGFLKDLSEKKEHPPSILVAPVRDEDLINAVKHLPGCKLVQEGGSFFDDVQDEAQKFLGRVSYPELASQLTSKAREPSRPQGYVDIRLHMSPRSLSFTLSTYEMFIIDEDNKKGKVKIGEVDLDWRTFQNLAKKSKNMEDFGESPSWMEELKQVGDSLWRELCLGYSKFRDHFTEHVQEVNGIENTRIRFWMRMVDRDEDEQMASLSKEMYAVLLEALWDDQRTFLMLQAPIYRDISISNFEDMIPLPLFDPRAKEDAINCLIIEADTSTDDNTEVYLKWPGKTPQKIKLEELKHIKGEKGECELLENYLKRDAPQGMIGKVHRLVKKDVPEKMTFKDWVFQVLEDEGPWHLVHYAGHSLIANDEEGYVFLPGKNIPEEVKIKEFGRFLRKAKVRFLYLSSCQSSKDDFVFQLASQGVPAILGFRWSIVDDKAKEFALKFYEYLFEYRSTDQAFLKARCYVHKYADNPIWASPMLVILGGRPL